MGGHRAVPAADQPIHPSIEDGTMRSIIAALAAACLTAADARRKHKRG
jgi:hypothetical protein